MRGLTVMMLIGVAFAGCADAPADAEATDDTDFDDVDVQVDDTTGAILGVVVDQSISPVAGATVVLKMETPTEQVTDDQGRFAFSKVPAGVHFLDVSSPLHEGVQTTATVEAGVAQPDIVRIQIQSLYTGEPFVNPITVEGFFQCSQAGMPGYLYTSSPCHSQSANVDLCDNGVCMPQEREFHADVGDGWQTQVFEMTWKASLAGTSEQMGMSVSTYKPERNKNHWWASVASTNPMRFQLDVGEIHPTYQEGDGPFGPIPAEGWNDMSYYMSVRPSEDAVCPTQITCAPPGLAVEQEFTAYLHQFYFLPAPAEWSIVGGDEIPW